MEMQIPVVRIRDGRWHRSDRHGCVASTGGDVVAEEEVDADDIGRLRPKCPLCFDY